MTSAGVPGLVIALEDAATPAEGDDGRGLTHGFHAWSARMHPHTARSLIGSVAAPGAVVDPFMGGGTVMVEALCAGRAGFGGDINPIAAEVAWARTRLWSTERALGLETLATELAERSRDIRKHHAVPRELREAEGEWYDPPALAELWSLNQAIDALRDPDSRRMMRACLSTLVIKASRQRSDSVAELNADHRWVPAGRVSQWLVRRAVEHGQSLIALREAVPDGTPEPALSQRDARAPAPDLAGKVGLVITSPPYPGVYDYVQHQQRRYALFGLDPSDADAQEIGSRRQGASAGWMSVAWRFEQDLGAALAVWAEWLAEGGRVALVLGDGEHPERIIRVLPLVGRAAAAAGLVVSASVSQSRPVFGPGRQLRGESRDEHIIVLERAA
ncbi:MAG: hypothetical protein R3F39_00315 [Myxococcota bacterium]